MYDAIYHQITGEHYQTKIPSNELSIPNKAGIYAIYINNNTLLPKPFSTTLIQRNSSLLYIGKAGKSLRKRLYKQDLQHKGSSTFFRSLGAVQEYLPPKGSLVNMRNINNFKFSVADTYKMVEWINENLSIYWSIECDPQLITCYEKKLITDIKPIFNIQNNPERSEVLIDLRKKCKEYALTDIC